MSCAKLKSSQANHSQPAHLAYLSKFSNKFEVVFPKQKKLRSPSIYKKMILSSIYKKMQVVFHAQKDLGCLPFTKMNKVASIYNKIKAVFHSQKKNQDCLPFTKTLRLSSIHTKNGRYSLAGLSQAQLVPVWGWCSLLTNYHISQLYKQLWCKAKLGGRFEWPDYWECEIADSHLFDFPQKCTNCDFTKAFWINQ